MKTKLLAIVCGMAAISIGAGAQADVIVGWDFSQYGAADLGNPSASSAATNSVFDANGAGVMAASLGTATVVAGSLAPSAGASQNGTQASPNIRGYLPRGPIESNDGFPTFPVGQTSFNAFSTLQSEGQASANWYAMAALGNTTVDFEAPTLPNVTDWAFSFGARMLNGGGEVEGGELACEPNCEVTLGAADIQLDGASASTIEIDGVASAFPFTITTEDHRYRVTFTNSAVADDAAVVTLNLAGANGTPLIDNVAIEGTPTPLPEPGVSLALAAGVGLLAGLRRWRR